MVNVLIWTPTTLPLHSSPEHATVSKDTLDLYVTNFNARTLMAMLLIVESMANAKLIYYLDHQMVASAKLAGKEKIVSTAFHTGAVPIKTIMILLMLMD